MPVPGFIDIHMHGCAGVDVGTASPEGLHKIARMLAKHGTAAFLPTIPATSFEQCRYALGSIARVMADQKPLLDALKGSDPAGNEPDVSDDRRDGTCLKPLPEAFILGAHLEGPFILPEYKGAMDVDSFIPASLENWEKLTGKYAYTVRRMTVDPLDPGVMDIIPYLVSKGVSVTVGHTASKSEDVLAAFSSGADSVTHIFNAMPSMHHRDPGPVGASLSDENSFAEVICDFLHVNKLAVKAVIRAKGADRVAVITDSCEAAGMPDGPYTLCGKPISVINGEARTPTGKLASSTVFMDRERLNLKSLGFSDEDIVKLLHETPLNAMHATDAEKRAIGRIYASIDGSGYACGLFYV